MTGSEAPARASSSGLDRRGFLAASATVATAAFIPSTHAAPVLTEVPDSGWSLWLDREASFADDAIFLPDDVDLARLPVTSPTGGWQALSSATAREVTLPTTVEEHFWGETGSRPYTGAEYRYAEDDPVPQNGAYRGVSWWWRDIDVPESARGKRILLHIRGARLRAEVFLNEVLVGYSVLSELPIHCDVTHAMRPGGANRLAIRITNPGGRYDWRDSTTMRWGSAKLFASHGFGGLDRGMTLSAHPLDAHIQDAWVLNTPDPHEVTAYMEIAFARAPQDLQGLRRRARVLLTDASGVPQIHREDPSRTVILNDGFVQRGAAQAMYLPYDDHYYRSDVEQWGGWWVNHQGAADQWYDKFYQGPDDYIHRQTGKPFIVEFGEMQGCAVADNHAAMVRALKAHGQSYDLADHRAVLSPTSAFLDRWGFRKAFPTDDSLFLSIGRKAYESWENYLENIRIGDEVDIAAISGWETTAIENHSGIVDNLRGFKADPALVRRSLLPVRACAKQRRLVYDLGEAASLDLYLFNDTNRPAPGTLELTLTGPDGATRSVGRWSVPAFEKDVFRQLIAQGVPLPRFAQAGAWQIRLAHSACPDATFERAFWVVPALPRLPRALRIGLAGVARSVQRELASFAGVQVEPFQPGARYDGIIASGLEGEEIARRQVGEQTGLETPPMAKDKPKLVQGTLPKAVLAAVRAGTPLFALVPEDGLADGVARQLSGLGLFDYRGQVGNLRAPWMGNWNYLRAHPLFDGIPADTATSVLHQVEGQPSNGLLVEGVGLEIIAGYSRDHDRANGAATLIARKGPMRVAVHRMPDMVKPLQRRLYANVVRWLAEARA